MPKTELKSYFAGILDGEGCLNIHQNSSERSFNARVMIGMTDNSVLEMMKREYGGTIQYIKSRKENWKDSYMWYLTGEEMDRFLEDISPYVVIKKKQIDTILEFRKHMKENRPFMKGKKGVQKISDEIYNIRLILKKTLNNLNRRGIAYAA